MRCLIIGGDGMLGHRLLRSWSSRHDVKVTLRRQLADYQRYALFTSKNSYDGVDVRNVQRLREVIADFKPEAVINAAGIVKQRTDSDDASVNLQVNAVFPQRLMQLCRLVGARLVHISTDCVFKGSRGMYTEQDIPDADDFYGMTKYAGEVTDADAITLRSSIIGLELGRKRGLLEWFLSQKSDVPGFTRAIFSGIPTVEMARVIEMVLQQPSLTGIWHVASPPISKYDLLRGLAAQLKLQDVKVIPDDGFQCDRSLCGDAFAQRTGYVSSSWQKMIAEIADEIRQRDATRDAA